MGKERDYEGSDGVCTIPSTHKGKQLTAVLVDKGSRRLTFNQGIRGVCINPGRSTFTILFSNENGDPAYATFDRKKNLCYLVWRSNTKARPRY